jgi:hypothetical protein
MRLKWLSGALVAGGLLGMAPAALAATSITCAELPGAVGVATAGEVLQLPAGKCQTEVSLANTAAFTLEGSSGGGTVLEPTGPSKSIVQSSEGVQFTLSGLTFTGANGAPAILLTGPGEAVTLSGDTFTGNRYPGGYGAGVSIQLPAASTATQPTQILDDTFTGNQSGGGGGLALLGSSPLLVSASTFTANSSSLGGGALVVSSRFSGDGAVQITGSTFGGPSVEDANTSAAVGGAGEIALLPTQSLTLSSNTFENNRIAGAKTATNEREGAGLFLGLTFEQTGYPVTQTNDVFAENAIEATQHEPTPLLPEGGAGEWITGLSVLSTGDRFTGNRVAVNDGEPPEGGALGAFASAPVGATPAQPAAFTGRDDLFSANSTAAGGWGGAIYVGGPPQSCTGICPGSSLTLDDSTVVANSIDLSPGSEGGAIWGSPNDTLTLANTILYGNTPQPEIYGFASTPPTIAYSDVCTETGGPTITGTGNICGDPKLNPDGSETESSPTIDQGSNALVPAGLTTDIAGNPRILNSHQGCYGPPPAPVVDIGAFEYTGPGPIPSCPPQIHFCKCKKPEHYTPKVEIAAGTLLDRHGKVTVRLTCPRQVDYCDGTVTLSSTRVIPGTKRGRRRRPHHQMVLASAHFHILGGKSASIKISLSAPTTVATALTRHRSIGVLVQTRDHDGAGVTATSKRSMKLRLRDARKH